MTDQLPPTDSAAPAVPEAEDSAEITAQTAAQEQQPESTPDPQALLRAAELKIAEHHDAWLRAKAETENLRRRAQEDIGKAHKYAAEKFASEMLPVKDSLEAALASESSTLENLRDGVEVTLRQLIAAFEKSGLLEINPLEQRFDPNQHQAMSALEADGEPNRVLQVLQKGYALNERVIRPALVIVSKSRGA